MILYMIIAILGSILRSINNNQLTITSLESTHIVLVSIRRNVKMTKCPVHTELFEDTCPDCKKEYNELKGIEDFTTGTHHLGSDYKGREYKDYKEFTEERAKKLYGELLVQYLKKNCSEEEASEKARAIIRQQCRLRGMPPWSWT